MKITPTEQAIIDDVAAAAKKVGSFLSAVAGNPLTKEAEALLPSIGSLVGKLAIGGAALGGFAAAIPVVEGVIVELQNLGMKPNEDLDHVGPGRDEMRDGYSGN